MKNRYLRLTWACYTTNIAMAVVGNLSPLLFLTFRSLYGISYSLLPPAITPVPAFEGNMMIRVVENLPIAS